MLSSADVFTLEQTYNFERFFIDFKRANFPSLDGVLQWLCFRTIFRKSGIKHQFQYSNNTSFTVRVIILNLDLHHVIIHQEPSMVHLFSITCIICQTVHRPDYLAFLELDFGWDWKQEDGGE